jgi:hypothetical protein
MSMRTALLQVIHLHILIWCHEMNDSATTKAVAEGGNIYTWYSLGHNPNNMSAASHSFCCYLVLSCNVPDLYSTTHRPALFKYTTLAHNHGLLVLLHVPSTTTDQHCSQIS